MSKGITVQEAAQRLTEAGARLSDRYQRGTQGKGGRWLTGAGGAQGNYSAGVQASIAAGSFSKGVQRAGAGSYDAGVQRKGVINWPQGMALGGDKYARNTSAAAALWNQPLSTPKGPRRSAANKQRMAQNVDRFEKLKS